MRLLQSAEYQPQAHAQFGLIEAELRTIFPAAAVEHVGASSIPGALSKGDLDVCLLVSPEQHAGVVNTLEAAGYVAKADTLRTAELCMLLAPQAAIDTALQVVAQGSKYEFFMHFRDALRADPRLVAQYNDIKKTHAHAGATRYRQAKAAFIEHVLKQARTEKSD